MDPYSLPKEFDVLVVGTGLTESIVSAALSRSGHTVIHIDPRGYYGGQWSSFNLQNWQEGSIAHCAEKYRNVVSEVGDIFWNDSISSFEQVWYEENESKKSELEKQSRKFNIDTLTKVIMARDPMIELLIQSDVARYLEFLKVGKLFTNAFKQDHIIQCVPFSRCDIFQDNSISLVEKRMLVKFIESVLDSSESNVENVQDQHSVSLFPELADKSRLTPSLRHLILSALKEVGDDPDFSEKEAFIVRSNTFLKSIGRYQNQTPYLWPLFGPGELSQAFCRLSAVYGGIYILGRYMDSIKKASSGFHVCSENDEFIVKHMILGSELRHQSQNDAHCKYLGRAVIITTEVHMAKLCVDEEESKSKPEDGVWLYKLGRFEVIEMNHKTHSVPKGFHFVSISFYLNDPDENVKRTVEEEFSKLLSFCDENNQDRNAGDCALSINKPTAIYGSYFRIKIEDPPSANCVVYSHADSKIFSSSVSDISYEECVFQAKRIFKSLYPNEEFLPKMPSSSEEDEEDVVDGST